jgi:hypothetical protein
MTRQARRPKSSARVQGRGRSRDPAVSVAFLVGATAAAAAIAALFFGIGVNNQKAGIANPPSLQQLLQRDIKRDQEALDKGALTYHRPGRLYPNKPFTLRVTVTDIGKHPTGVWSAAYLSYTLGLVVYPGDVPTGGIVSLSATLCANLRCNSLDAGPTQAIVGLGSSASWSWQLVPEQPGKASITLAASIYDGYSNITLSEEIIPISFGISAESDFHRSYSHEISKATGFINSVAGLVTSIGGAIALIAGGIASIIRWKRSRKARTEKLKREEAEKAREAEKLKREEAEKAREAERRRQAAEKRRQEERERQKRDPTWMKPS